MKNYSALSVLYNFLMRGISYKTWAKYILALAKLNEKKCSKVLELAGGTGSVAEILSPKFNLYIYTDLAPDMLLYNKSKLVANKAACDMTRLPFKNKFDLVFSTFDSINYLMTKKNFLLLLNEVDLVLDDDGLFAFDVSLELNSRKYQKLLNRKGKVGGISFIQKSNYDETKRIHFNYFEITLPDGKVVNEIHKQKIWPAETYFQMIDKSPFYVQHCFEAFSFNSVNEKTERAQFILKKRKNGKL